MVNTNNTLKRTLSKFLSEIKFKLTIRKLVGPTISSAELQEVVKGVTVDLDEAVNNKLNEVFSDYFDAPENKKDNGDILSVGELVQMYKDGQQESKVPVIRPKQEERAA